MFKSRSNFAKWNFVKFNTEDSRYYVDGFVRYMGCTWNTTFDVNLNSRNTLKYLNFIPYCFP